MSDGNGVTPPKQPPSLIGGAAPSPAAPKAAGGEPRILAGLDGKGAKAVKSAAKSTPVGARTGRKGMWIGVVALLALVVAAGGVWRAQQPTRPDEAMVDARPPSDAANGSAAGSQARQDASAASSTVATAQTGGGATGSPPTNSGTGQTPPQTATIVDSATQGGSGAVTSASAANAANAQRAAPQSDPMQALVAKTEARDAHDKHHPTTVADAKDAKSKHDDKKLTRHERALALREAREQDRAKTAARAKNEDPDADILAALFKHTNATDAPGAAATGAKKGNGGTDIARTVKPAAGSLAARVEACRSKGFFDGEVCRWQVCNGHWGSDPACPGNAPTSAATH